MTQSERVLRALQAAGDRGITAVDFALPDVVDGLPPITRVAARVKDLREQGHMIVAAGTRQQCRVYTLVSQQELQEATVSPEGDLAYGAAPDGLFGTPETSRRGPVCAIYDTWEDE